MELSAYCVGSSLLPTSSSYYLSSQTLHPRGAPTVHRDCSGEWLLLCGCWRRRIQGPALYRAAGAQPLSVQGLLVGWFEVEGHRSQEVPSDPPLTFFPQQVSSRPAVQRPQAEGRCQWEHLCG